MELLCCIWHRLIWICSGHNEIRLLSKHVLGETYCPLSDLPQLQAMTSNRIRMDKMKTLGGSEVASPDRNPTKHLWKDLKLALGRRHLWNLREVKQFAQEVWNKSPSEKSQQELQKVAVIASKGCCKILC